jgi:hypothetical protein
MGNWWNGWETKPGSLGILCVAHFGSAHPWNGCLVEKVTVSYSYHSSIRVSIPCHYMLQPNVLESEAQDRVDREDDYEILHATVMYLSLCLC